MHRRDNGDVGACREKGHCFMFSKKKRRKKRETLFVHVVFLCRMKNTINNLKC